MAMETFLYNVVFLLNDVVILFIRITSNAQVPLDSPEPHVCSIYLFAFSPGGTEIFKIQIRSDLFLLRNIRIHEK